MLYIGLVVGAFLGICISIIALGIFKDIVTRANSRKGTDDGCDQRESEPLPSLLSSFPAEKEKWLSDVSR